jgi:hypothetical protein
MEGKGNVVGGVTRALVEQLIAESGGGSSLPDQTGNAGKFLGTDGTDASWETVSAGTVDVVSNVATDRILGRTTAGTGDSEQLTASAVRTLINVEDGATSNTGALADLDTVDTAQIDDNAITNAKIAGAGTRDATTFYRGDGTFAAPAGGGGGLENIVEDTTPQLGGDLDVNGNNITSTTGLDVSIGASAGNDFTIDTSKLVVEGDTGNVGIGTASPDAPLHIYGNGGSNQGLIQLEHSGDFTGSTSSGPHFYGKINGQNSWWIGSFDSVNYGDDLNIAAWTGMVNGSDSRGIRFFTTKGGSASEKVRINDDGNVGIGTTTPDTKLHVAGAVTQEPLSSDPSDPDEGNSVQWVSDGTGTGDAGDVMLKVNVAGTTKVITLIDYSVA